MPSQLRAVTKEGDFGSLKGRPARAVLLDMDDTIFDHALTSRLALGRLRKRSPGLRALTLDELWRRYQALLEAAHPDILRGRLSIDVARVERFRTLAALSDDERGTRNAKELVEGYRALYRQLRRPVPGAIPFLRWLRPRVRVGVVTNSLVTEQEEKAEYLGIDRLIDTLVVSEGVGVAKPDPRIFRIALGRLSVPPEEAVMIGDSWTNDVEGALAAGVRPVWFNRFGLSRPETGAAGNVLQIRSFRPPSAIGRTVGATPG
jgi:HAD superfamily hydrolase (TIGR01549 family)